MTPRAVLLCVVCLVGAGCDGGPAAPPSDEPPAPNRLAFVEGRSVDPAGAEISVRPPDHCHVQRTTRGSARIEGATLRLEDAAFELRLRLRAWPYDAAAFDSTLTGSVDRHGALGTLALDDAVLFATLAPDAVNVYDPLGALRGPAVDCPLLRFTDGPFARQPALPSGADRKTFDGVALGEFALPYWFSVVSTTYVTYDSLRVDLHPDGTYLARLSYHFTGQPAPLTATAMGTYAGAGALRVLDPSRVRAQFMTQSEASDEATLYGSSFEFRAAPGTAGPRWPSGRFDRITLHERRP